MQEDGIIGQRRSRENLCLVIFLCGQLSLLSAGKQTGQKVRATPSAKAPRVLFIYSTPPHTPINSEDSNETVFSCVTIWSFIFLFHK